MTTETHKNPAQKAGEASVNSFRRDLGPFVVAAEKTRMPMIFLSATKDHSVLFANDAFLKLTGYSRKEVLATDFRCLLAEGVNEHNRAIFESAFQGQLDDDPEVHYKRKDGSEFWASMFVAPVCDKSGAIVQHFASFADITPHRLEYRRCQALIDELNHRVKNTLATVLSIVNHALRGPDAPPEIRLAIESRIQALSRSHDLLTKAKWDGAGLYDLVEMAMKPFDGITSRGDRLTLNGENILLPPKTALALGIALNELATNSVKYGALSDDGGSLKVDWEVVRGDLDERLVIRWQERNGPIVAQPTHSGFGTWVLGRGVAFELGGTVTLDYLADGVICVIDMPAPQRADSLQ